MTPSATQSSAEPTTIPWVRASLPWIMSTTMHACLLLALSTTYGWRSGAAEQASVTSGAALRGSLETTVSLEGGDEGDNPTADPSAPGNFQDDETLPGPFQLSNEQRNDAAREQVGSLLTDRPMLDLSEVHPASVNGLGVGGVKPTVAGVDRALRKSNSAGTGDGSGKRPGRGGAYGEAHTGVFGIEGQGFKFIYVFDRSGSMDGHGGTPLAAAKTQLLASLDDLGQTHQFQIIFYNEHPRIFNPGGATGRLVFANDQNKALARRFVGGITADGGTEHEEALVTALKMAPDVIFFLTDADDPQLSTKQLARIERLNRGTSINAIEFGYGPRLERENFLVALARQNGGRHIYVDVSKLPRIR